MCKGLCLACYHMISMQALMLPFLVQVVSSADLTDILGERPYHAAELRNIDKFRDGFAKKVTSAAAAVADAANQAAEDAAKLGKHVSGESEVDLEGKVVAT